MYLNKNDKLNAEKKLIESWEWLTEDIDNYEEKLNTSIVLQSSYETMVQEGIIPNGWLESLLTEDSMLTEAPIRTGATGDNLVPRVIFPIIRRVMPSLIANQLVSVQPITARTGVVYHISYQFSNTKGDVVAGDEFSASPINAKKGPGFSTFYSSPKFGPFEATIVDAGSGNTAIATGNKITGFIGTDHTKFTIKKIEVYNKTTGLAYRTVLNAVSNVVDFSTPYANVGYDADSGDIVLRRVGDAETPWAEGDNVVVYLEYDMEGSSIIPELEYVIGSKTVETTQRKLKVHWTKEAEQDMEAYHKIDVDSELVKIASMQMNYEKDRELLNFIADITPPEASLVHQWNNDVSGPGGNNTQGNYLDRHRALAQMIYIAAARIAQFNRQGPASWAVVSPQIGAVIAMLPNFKGEMNSGTFNIYDAGLLGNGMKVYIDPNRVGTKAGEIQLGYKSTNTAYGAGVVYAPYVDWMSNVVVNPDNFNNVRGFFSRYAITEVERGRWFYGKVNVTGMDFI